MNTTDKTTKIENEIDNLLNKNIALLSNDDIKPLIESLTDASMYDKAVEVVAKKFGIELKVVSHRFDSMAWDNDGQKRRIFKLKLIRGNNNYTFDFGQSVAKSCKDNSNAWEQLKGNDLVEVYAGALAQSSRVSGSVKFSETKKELENLSDVKLLSYAQLLKDDFDLSVSKYNKKQRTKYDHIKNFGSVESAVPFIKKAIQRKIDDLKRESVMSNEPLTEVIEPTLYDVLTCLQKYDVGTFEDFCSDYGYDTDSRTAFKTYKAVVKEFQAMERLFNSEELEVLQMIQ